MRSRFGGAWRHWPITISSNPRESAEFTPVSKHPSTRFDHLRAMREAQFARNEALKKQADKMHALVQSTEAEESPQPAEPETPKEPETAVKPKRAAAQKKAAEKAAPKKAAKTAKVAKKAKAAAKSKK
jgi:hypothetical protein